METLPDILPAVDENIPEVLIQNFLCFFFLKAAPEFSSKVVPGMLPEDSAGVS